jgi:hypothetical protein
MPPPFQTSLSFFDVQYHRVTIFRVVQVRGIVCTPYFDEIHPHLTVLVDSIHTTLRLREKHSGKENLDVLLPVGMSFQQCA